MVNMFPLVLIAVIYLFEGATTLSPHDVQGFFENCDMTQLKDNVRKWNNILPNGDWVGYKTRDDLKERCDERIESGKNLVEFLQDCLAEDIKDGIPEFEQLGVDRMQEMCNNETIVEGAITDEISNVVDEHIFHDCMKLVNLEDDEIIDEESADLIVPRFCCLWATAWECFDQTITGPNEEAHSKTIGHFDFYLDVMMKQMCGQEPIGDICGTVPQKAASNGKLIWVMLWMNEFEIFGQHSS